MKLLATIIIILSLLTVPAQAQFYSNKVQLTGSEIIVFECINSTGEDQETIVATALISSAHKIIGFSIMPYDPTKNSEGVLGIWDTVPDGSGGTICEAVAEAERLDEGHVYNWFPYPKPIYTQLILRQGANTSVLIYYVAK